MSLQSILFESPLSLGAILIASAGIAFQVWRTRRTVATGRVALAGLFAIPTLLGLQWAVVTEREKIMDHCHELAAAVGHAHLPTLRDRMSDHIIVTDGEESIDRTDFIARVEKGLMRWDVQEEGLRELEVDVRNGVAIATFVATCRLVSNDAMIPRFLSKWKLHFVSQNDNWRVSKIELLPTEFFPSRSLDDLLHRAR